MPARSDMLGENTSFTRQCGVLAIAWLLLNLPLLLGIHILPWDASDQFYPTVYFNAHSLRHGLAPWWNPYVYAGYPQIADPQGMMFSPLLMSWMLLPANPGPTWFAWGVLLHLLLGGFAILGVFRSMALRPWSALMGAFVFMFGGVAASRLHHVPILLAYAYAPIVLLALKRFIASPGWRRATLLGLSAGVLLVHLVQLTYLLVFALAAYGVAATAVHWKSYTAQDYRRWLGGVVLAACIALVIGLPQLLMTVAFATLSNRPELPLQASSNASLDPSAMLSLFVPNAINAMHGTYGQLALVMEGYFYIGAIPGLMLLGLPAAWREGAYKRQLVFLAVFSAISILYMLGLRTPFYGWLYSWLPGIKLFRRPHDAAYLLNLALAFAVAIGANYIRLESKPRWLWLLGIASVWMLTSSVFMRSADTHWQTFTIVPPLLAAATWLAIRKRQISNTVIALLLLATMIADYRCFSLNGSFNEGRNVAKAFLRDDSANFLQQHLVGAPDKLPSRVEPVDASVFWDNLVVLRELSSTQGYNPMRYALYDWWYGARDNGNYPRPRTPFNTASSSALANLLAVEYVVRNIRPDDAPWLAPPGYRRVSASSSSEVWRNEHAYPRLLTPAHAELVGDISPEAFEQVDFSEKALLTPRNAEDREASRDSLGRCSHRLRVLSARSTPTRIEVKTTGDAGGWLVLSELDFPGWRADANGQPLHIHRTNGMFRAVCVPSGDQTVTLTYHPWDMVATVWREHMSS
jgi:Bacterial membrane protein YfhO